jgi:hypothetical protein
MGNEIKGIVRPPMEMPSHLQGQRSQLAVRKAPKVEVPLLITLFAWYCFLRSSMFLVFALIVGIAPDSTTAQFVGSHFNPVPPPRPTEYGMHSSASLIPAIPPEPVFYALAILYGIIGWRWITRDWRARWGAMFISGATAAKIAIDWMADRAAGSPTWGAVPGDALTTGGSPFHGQAIAFAILWNLAICCYLAFYPGMTEAFKETPWE